MNIIDALLVAKIHARPNLVRRPTLSFHFSIDALYLRPSALVFAGRPQSTENVADSTRSSSDRRNPLDDCNGTQDLHARTRSTFTQIEREEQPAVVRPAVRPLLRLKDKLGSV